MKYLAGDIEANNWINFVIGGVYDGKDYKEFLTAKEMLKYLLTKKYNRYRFYFHNGGRYDFLFYIESLLEKYDIKFVEAGSQIIAIKIYDGRNTWTFVDSYKMLTASLEKLIDTFDIPYKKIKIDFNKRLSAKDPRVRKHLENDCKALYEIIGKFSEEVGELKLTIASQAMQIFQDEYFEGDLVKLKGKSEASFRKKYYHGGRVEVFKGYGENLYYYDINSLYPFVMCKKMPSGFYKSTNKYIKNKIGFYDIELLQDTNFYVSPLIHSEKHSNYYVNGNKGEIFSLSSAELEYLKEKKIKFKIIKGIVFDKQEYIFNDFVNNYYKMKNNNKGNFRYFIAKLIMNSLYGKFGQKILSENIETFHGQSNCEIYDAEYNLVLVKTENKTKFHLVYIAAYITALARIELLKLIDKCKPDEIYYCDTDSIITSRKLKTSDKLGDIKLEHKIKKAVFLLPKTYMIIDNKGKEIAKIKGFKSHDFTFPKLLKALKNNTSLNYSYDKMLSFRECLTRVKGIKSSAGMFLKIVEQKKTLNPRYLRREIIPDKNFIFNTKPLTKEFFKNGKN